MSQLRAREHWTSGFGFVLASVGSAVGLGNVWRFSYVAGENGGGAFLLIYLAMVLVLGVPLLVGEFALGRSAQRESVAAVRSVAPAWGWRQLGWLSVAVAVLILAYYAVIAGWVLKYLALFAAGAFRHVPPQGFAAVFHDHVAGAVEPLAWQGAGLVATAAVVASGVRGIEKACRFLIPLLAILLVLLAVRSAALPAFAAGAAFLFDPDWSAFLRPGVYLAAAGQAFFSLGLAMGAAVAFGSYTAASTSLPRAALFVAVGDTLFAILAGLLIFPAVFSFGLDPAQGPGLAFVVLPQVFVQMPWGSAVGAAFFLLLCAAALTSMISLLEVPVACLVERFGAARAPASWACAGAVFLLGVPASWGFGPLAWVEAARGFAVMDLMDFVAVSLLLPLNGLLLAVVLGWIWPRQQAVAAAAIRSRRLGSSWSFSLRYLLPALLAAILLAGVLG